MIGAQQYMQPQQTAVVTPQITEMLNSMMPLIMIMMVMTRIGKHPYLQAPTPESASGDDMQ